MKSLLITYYASLSVCFVVPLFLVWCRRYSDGIGGRLGLGMISGSAFLVLWQARRDPFMFAPLPETIVLVAGMAIFFLWYIYKFLRRQWGPWYEDWRRAQRKTNESAP